MNPALLTYNFFGKIKYYVWKDDEDICTITD